MPLSSLTAAIELFKKLPTRPERVQRELSLQMALGQALIVTKRIGSSGSRAGFQLVRESCASSLGDPQLYSQCCMDLWLYICIRGEFRTAYELAEQLCAGPSTRTISDLLLRAHRCGQTIADIWEASTSQGASGERDFTL